MKIIYSWLKEFVDFDWTPEELATRLTLAGLEVEGIEKTGAAFTGVVTGKVISREKHPNADKLSICQVDTGTGTPVQIVCGATNVAAGQTVPVALPGAELPGGFKITKATIRGTESSGMICSKSELGMEEGKSPGIWEMDTSLAIGQNLADVLGIKSETVLEVAITANRGDCLSHLGIAREVSALTGNPLKMPDTAISPEYFLKTDSSAFISIDLPAPDGCPVYIGWYIEKVRTIESPEWMKKRLELMGLRPRNILVDATNYVMMELGQPLHAFDYKHIKSKTIRVKTVSSQAFTTLDSKKRDLPDQSMMICDDHEPVALAGIMGGENSEVEESTTEVLLESAWFNPSSIRRTAKKLGLSTDSSYRFERGVDTNLQELAAKRAAKLMVEACGGKVASSPVHGQVKPFENLEVTVRFNRISRVLGIEIPKDRIHRILEDLGFKLIGENTSEMVVRVPSHRPDITREIDVIEELIRIHGFETIPESDRVTAFFSSDSNKEFDEQNRIKLLLAGAGFQEIYCNSMISQPEATLVSDKPVEILNPQSEDMKMLRPSMIPGLLQVVQRNLNVGVHDLRLFEFGRTFKKESSERYKKLPDYTENKILALAVTGHFMPETWNQPARQVGFFDLKAWIQAVLNATGNVSTLTFAPSSNPNYSTGMVAQAGGKVVAEFGEIASKITGHYDIRVPVFIAEIDLDTLGNLQKIQQKYTGLPKFLPIEKDLAFWISQEIPAGTLMASIHASKPEWIKDVRVFDVFEPKNDSDGRRSIAFRMTLQHPDRTFTDDDINQWIREVKTRMEKEHNAELRGA